MNDHLSHSSKLINITELVKEISPSLTDISRKRIDDEVSTLEKSWHDLGDQIAERENELRTLSRASSDVLELISDCNHKLNILESELNSIESDYTKDLSDFDNVQKRLLVSFSSIFSFKIQLYENP